MNNPLDVLCSVSHNFFHGEHDSWILFGSGITRPMQLWVEANDHNKETVFWDELIDIVYNYMGIGKHEKFRDLTHYEEVKDHCFDMLSKLKNIIDELDCSYKFLVWVNDDYIYIIVIRR